MSGTVSDVNAIALSGFSPRPQASSQTGNSGTLPFSAYLDSTTSASTQASPATGGQTLRRQTLPRKRLPLKTPPRKPRLDTKCRQWRPGLERGLKFRRRRQCFRALGHGRTRAATRPAPARPPTARTRTSANTSSSGNTSGKAAGAGNVNANVTGSAPVPTESGGRSRTGGQDRECEWRGRPCRPVPARSRRGSRQCGCRDHCKRAANRDAGLRNKSRRRQDCRQERRHRRRCRTAQRRRPQQRPSNCGRHQYRHGNAKRHPRRPARTATASRSAIPAKAATRQALRPVRGRILPVRRMQPTTTRKRRP